MNKIDEEKSEGKEKEKQREREKIKERRIRTHRVVKR